MLDTILSKLTCLKLSVYVGVFNPITDLTKKNLILLQGLRVDKDIIKIYSNKFNKHIS